MQKVEWFKLQLMLSGNTYIDPINLPPLPPGKSEIDVAADYLFKLRQAMRVQLQKTLGEVFNREERNIRYFLTVPAIWNDAGKAATRAAAIQAGFIRDENDNRLTLITEPEAAAMFCSKTGLLNLKIHVAVHMKSKKKHLLPWPNAPPVAVTLAVLLRSTEISLISCAQRSER